MSRFPLLEIYPKELIEQIIKRCIYKAVYHNTVYNCEKIEAANDRELGFIKWKFIYITKNEEAIISDAELYWQNKDIHNILSSEESKLQNNLYVCNILFPSKHTLGNKHILMCICAKTLEWLFLNSAFFRERGQIIFLYAFFPKISSEVICYFTGHTASLAGLESIISFPDSSDSKESMCNAGDLGSIPGLGRSPGAGNGKSL